MSAPYEQCRYLRRNDERCTAEVADENGEILLCRKHVARALQLINRALKERGVKKTPALSK